LQEITGGAIEKANLKSIFISNSWTKHYHGEGTNTIKILKLELNEKNRCMSGWKKVDIDCNQDKVSQLFLERWEEKYVQSRNDELMIISEIGFRYSEEKSSN